VTGNGQKHALTCTAMSVPGRIRTCDTAFGSALTDSAMIHVMMTIIHGERPLRRARRLHVPLGLATDLDTEHGGTEANKRDGARQVGRLNVGGLQL
jgi:hypothetical protein